MASLLLVIIYLAFISLGLPDSLLGSAWPILHAELGVPLSFAGIITMIISGSTILSSLLSDKLTRRFGAGKVTAVSVLLTAVALLGFSLSSRFWMLCVLAVPYGLGAGAIDAALNTYVAVHFAARHMSWLHAMWGVGVTVSPYIMSGCLVGGYGWQSGYFTVSVLQILLTVFLFCSLPLWKQKKVAAEKEMQTGSGKNVLHIRGVPAVLICFFAYCALESTAGLWASSYLVLARGVTEVTAARFAALFYMGITLGRFLCGFVADKLGDRALIRLGLLGIAFGIVCVLAPLPTDGAALAGLVVIGFGCAPIYPSIIHSTPQNFGAENAQKVVGIQMASAYVGSTCMPPLFGVLAEHISVGIYPWYLAAFAVLMLAMQEWLRRLVR